MSDESIKASYLLGGGGFEMEVVDGNSDKVTLEEPSMGGEYNRS